jgi:hypothetical protein
MTQSDRARRIEYMRRYNPTYYQQHREHLISRTRRWQIRRRAEVEAYKVTVGCAICGYHGCAEALDLHHADPSVKTGNVSQLIRNFGWSKRALWSEIAKCHVLCANCHREVHAGITFPPAQLRFDPAFVPARAPHRLYRYDVDTRRDIVPRLKDGWTKTRVAKHLGICRATLDRRLAALEEEPSGESTALLTSEAQESSPAITRAGGSRPTVEP